MNDLAVIILAAGDQKRWATEGFKQMLPVWGKPVIHRTVQQVRDAYQVEPVIAVKQGQPFGRYTYFYPDDHRIICDTFGSTKSLWQRETILLMGDACYTDECISTIGSLNYFVFGKGAEIFGVKFFQGQWERVEKAIEAAKVYARKTGKGKIWNVYRAYEGFGQEEHRFGDNYYKLPDGDSTIDFDTPEKYQRWLDKHEGQR